MLSMKSLGLMLLSLSFSHGVLCQESGAGLGPIDISEVPGGGAETPSQAVSEMQLLADSVCQIQLFDPSVIFHFDTIYNWACGGSWDGAPVDSTNGPTDHQRQLALDLSFFDKSDSGSVYVELHNLITGNGIWTTGSCYDGFTLTGVMVQAPGVLSVDLNRARPGQEVCYGDCSNPEPLCQLEGWYAAVDDTGFSMSTSGCPNFGLVSFGSISNSTRIRNGFLVELEVDDSFTMDSLTVEVQFGCGQQTIVPIDYSSWGCTDIIACNFDAGVTIEDGSCLYPSCDEPSACNYDPQAVCGGGECIPSGCRESDACNFDPEAQCDGEECDYSCCPGPGCCDWPLVWNATTQQCLLAKQTCGEGTTWNGLMNQCVPADLCLADLDNDGVVGMSDLMDVLSRFGVVCPDTGFWQNPDGMNGSTNQAESDSCATACCPGPGCCAAPAFWDSGTQMCAISELACGEGTYWSESLGQCLPVDLCFADLNFDGEVGMADLLALLPSFGVCPEEVWHCGDPLEYHGYDYETVQIGGQCWFAENLRAEQYSNGDPIPMILDDAEWQGSSEGARCWINNDSTFFGFPGFLYHGYAVTDNRGVCPEMWHVANDLEWMALEIAHGLSEFEAHESGIRGGDIQLSQKMRVESWGGTNELGFAAQKGGYRRWENGSFSGGIDSGAYWSNGDSLGGPGYREFHGPWEGVARGEIGISEGLSIRCIQDSE